jgi:hypothetical protein
MAAQPIGPTEQINRSTAALMDFPSYVEKSAVNVASMLMWQLQCLGGKDKEPARIYPYRNLNIAPDKKLSQTKSFHIKPCESLFLCRRCRRCVVNKMPICILQLVCWEKTRLIGIALRIIPCL